MEEFSQKTQSNPLFNPKIIAVSQTGRLIAKLMFRKVVKKELTIKSSVKRNPSNNEFTVKLETNRSGEWKDDESPINS